MTTKQKKIWEWRAWIGYGVTIEIVTGEDKADAEARMSRDKGLKQIIESAPYYGKWRIAFLIDQRG